MNRYDVLIIGAGLGGLTSGALLARQGFRVGVVEKNQRLGGYGVSYYSHGHRFDIATQALGGCGKKGIVRQILAELKLLDKVRFLACEPARVYYLPDSEKPFIQHGFISEQCSSLIREFPEYKKDIRACYATFEKIFTELQAIAEFSGDLLFGFAKNFPDLAEYSGITVKEFFDQLHLPVPLQSRIAARAEYCLLPLDRLSLVGFSCTEMSYGDGAWMVAGGVNQLVRILAQYIRDNRGSIIPETRVRRLLTDNGKVSGIEDTRGKKLAANGVIMAADGRNILAGSGELFDSFADKYKKLERSGSYFVCYYQVPASCVKDMAANIEVHDHKQIIAVKEKIRVYYILVPSLVDRDSAPTGFHSFCISAPLARGISPDKNDREKLRAELEKRVVKKFPSLANNLRFLFALTPDHFSAMTGNTGGAAYGWAQTPSQSGIYRLGNTTPISGLYLAGHWTMPGGGIAGVMTSGKLCTQAFVNKNGKIKN
jgi:prolycopene isomerase